jgi:hypothetical protein
MNVFNMGLLLGFVRIGVSSTIVLIVLTWHPQQVANAFLMTIAIVHFGFIAKTSIMQRDLSLFPPVLLVRSRKFFKGLFIKGNTFTFR